MVPGDAYLALIGAAVGPPWIAIGRRMTGSLNQAGTGPSGPEIGPNGPIGSASVDRARGLTSAAVIGLRSQEIRLRVITAPTTSSAGGSAARNGRRASRAASPANAASWRARRRPAPPWYRATLPVKPCVREAGEIPAQSRYGERPSEGASPVADHTVHARTFERKVGRIRAHFRLDPSFDPFEARGFASHATPPTPTSASEVPDPCPRPRLHRPPASAPCSPRSSSSWSPAPAAPPRPPRPRRRRRHSDRDRGPDRDARPDRRARPRSRPSRRP